MLVFLGDIPKEEGKNMNIDHLQIPYKNKLVADFHDHFQSSTIASLFSYNPWDEDSYLQRYQYLQMHRQEPFTRKQLVEVLRKSYGDEELPPTVEANLVRFEDEKSCVVIGGHQAGLMTGPLYTIYKAITIIQMARREEERLGVPVIPLFWVAGEDHDYEEVNHIWIRDLQENISKQVYASDPSRTNRVAISSMKLDQKKMEQWVEHLSSQLPDTLYKDEWIHTCRQITTSVTTWSQFFVAFMRTLFDQYGLLFIDATNPHLRQLESHFFVKLIKRNEEIRRQLWSTGQVLNEQHYDVPVHLEANHANLFIEIQGERFPLFHQHDMWVTRDGMHRFTSQQLIQIAEQTPERLSNNVLTRPLMQEYVFPTLVFVGGAGEIQYWSLLKSAFSTVGLQMPIVYPRIGVTLVEPLAWKRIKTLGLTWDDVFFRLEEKREVWLHQQSKIDLNQLFQSTNDQIDQIYHQLLNTLQEELGEHIKEIGQKNRKNIKREIDYLHRYAAKMITAKYKHQLRRFDEIAVRLLPAQKLQERVYNLIQIWNQFGLSWLNQLIEQPLLTDQHEHILVRL